MAPIEITEDYYKVLQVAESANFGDIRASYRKLALKCHPDKDRAKSATAAFQLLSSAYETLKDEELRRTYDARRPRAHTYACDKRPERGAGSEAPHAQSRRGPAGGQQENQARTTRLRNLESHRVKYASDIVELRKAISKIEAELQGLRAMDERDERRGQNSIVWRYISSAFFANNGNTEDEKLKCDQERLQRQSARTVKNKHLASKTTDLSRLALQLQSTDAQIAREKEAQEQEKRDRESKMWQELCEKQRREATERAREQAKRDKEMMERAREMREAAAAAEASIRASAEAARKARFAEARKARNQSQESYWNQESYVSLSQDGECRHKGWWPKIEGRYTCSECHAIRYKYILQCPGCGVLACVGCRPLLQKRKGQPRSSFDHKPDADYHDDYY